jgi:hypothetical protein
LEANKIDGTTHHMVKQETDWKQIIYSKEGGRFIYGHEDVSPHSLSNLAHLMPSDLEESK